MVTGQFALFAEKSASKTEAEIGDVIDYAVRVRSAGTSPVPAVSIEDRLPARLRLSSGLGAARRRGRARSGRQPRPRARRSRWGDPDGAPPSP